MVRIKVVKNQPSASSPSPSLSSSPSPAPPQQTSNRNKAGGGFNVAADVADVETRDPDETSPASVKSVADEHFQGVPISAALAELQQRLEDLEQRRNFLPTFDSESESLSTTDKMQIEVSSDQTDTLGFFVCFFFLN